MVLALDLDCHTTGMLFGISNSVWDFVNVCTAEIWLFMFIFIEFIALENVTMTGLFAVLLHRSFSMFDMSSTLLRISVSVGRLLSMNSCEVILDVCLDAGRSEGIDACAALHRSFVVFSCVGPGVMVSEARAIIC